MIRFPTTAADALPRAGEIVRAGATDLTECRRLGLRTGSLVDLRDVSELRGIRVHGGNTRIGAATRIAEVANDPGILAGYAGLAAAAGGLATPQIRAVATVAGNILQRSRCWYFRAGDELCLKRGGNACLARGGEHLYHGCFDLGPCVAVHPSTLAAALLAYGATVQLQGGGSKTMEEVLGDGADPTREHALAEGELIESIELPAPRAGERAAYHRAISRARAEWPLVEAVVRLSVDASNVITAATVVVGGVAPIPLRRAAVEAALVGKPATAETLADAAAQAAEGAKPLPHTGYKVELLQATVLDVLERALAAPSEPPAEPVAKPPTEPATEPVAKQP